MWWEVVFIKCSPVLIYSYEAVLPKPNDCGQNRQDSHSFHTHFSQEKVVVSFRRVSFSSWQLLTLVTVLQTLEAGDCRWRCSALSGGASSLPRLWCRLRWGILIILAPTAAQRMLMSVRIVVPKFSLTSAYLLVRMKIEDCTNFYFRSGMEDTQQPSDHQGGTMTSLR